MKILWIINGLSSEISPLFGIRQSYTGGWIQSAKNILSKCEGISLSVASVYKGKDFHKIEKDGILYYVLPCKEGQPSQYYSSLEEYWRRVNADFNPDIIHLYGTEYTHGLSYIKACGSHNVIVSIQGLISVIAKHYSDGISLLDKIKSTTIGDVFFGTSISSITKNSVRRGRFEHEIIEKVNYIEGRTSWDKAHVWSINPNLTYFNCNRFLRPVFYTNKWCFDYCEPHTIFISQARDSIKGVHQVFKALPIILRSFPDTKIYIAGNNIWNRHGLRKALLYNGYSNFLYKLAKRLRILDHITFTGPLNSTDMCEKLIHSNVFVSPSSIENSPNSVAEAQMVGVPCVASFVGGTMDMIEHGKTGYLYRFDEIEMLAKYVCDVFGNIELSKQLSMQERCVAESRHNVDKNITQLLNIYKTIMYESN